MDDTSENSNTMNEEKKIYVYCGNNSGWTWESRIEAYTLIAITAHGDISYKFSKKCHLPPNRISFVEFLLNDDAKRSLKAARESKNDEKDKKSETEEEEIMGPTLIDKLGVDCLIHIFSYLPLEKRLEMEDVCIKWRDVSKRAWYDVRELEVTGSLKLLRRTGITRSKFIEKLLMRCGAYLHTLKLHYICSSEILLLIGKHCHNLTTIELKFINYEEEHSLALSKMKKLESFSFTSIESLNDFPSEMQCLQNLPKIIKTIQIGDSSPVSADTLIYKSISPSNIERVLGEFNALNSLTIGHNEFRENVIEAISKLGTITKLSLPFCVISVGLNLLTNLSNLEYLNLQRVYSVNNNFLTELSTKCKKLKYLNVSYCTGLSNAGIIKLRDLDNLKVLLINGMEDGVSDLPLGELRGIKKLECKKCLGVKDPGVMELMRNCPNLELLDVRYTSISEETLHFAISVTRNRANSVILRLNVNIEEVFEIDWNAEGEDYSPFLVINDPNFKTKPRYPDSEEEYDSSDENYYDENAFPLNSDLE